MSNTPPAHRRPSTLHKLHPTSVAFFDEAGAIASDRFFGVGVIRLEDHPAILKKVKEIRKEYKYWDEFKWATVTGKNYSASVALIDLILSSAKFSCFIADRHAADPVFRFGSTFRAYEKLATQLLIGSVRPYELVSVIADNYSAPTDRSFEAAVREECNERLRRLAVTSVLQVDSRATEGLQLVDMMLGAVAFSFKARAGLASNGSRKGKLAEYLRLRLGIPDFDAGYSSADVNVKIYEHDKWVSRRALGGSEVTQSSARSGRRRRQRRSPDGPPYDLQLDEVAADEHDA